MVRPPSALLLAHKPVGVTSASLVEDLRRELPAEPRPKLSHGGALDPFAEGLVLLLVGAVNRLFERLHEAPKTYVATVVWGSETDTCDAGGAVTATGNASELTAARLQDALQSFIGWTPQVPPATSNKWVDGERAYVRAHRGEQFELPPSRVYCHRAGWLDHDLPRMSRLEVVVRGGFYVRSLARDLGRAVVARAHLTTLTRTAIGPWRDPGPASGSNTGPDSRPYGRVEVRGPAVLPWLPRLELSDDEWGALRRDGVAPLRAPTCADWPLPAGWLLPDPGPRGVQAVHRGRLVAIVGDGQVTVLPGGV